MKRSFLWLTLCIVAASSFAQDKKVALGLGFSPSLCRMKSSSSAMTSKGSIWGYNYGLIADFNFGENYALATGFFINSCGGKTDEIRKGPMGQTITRDLYLIQTIQVPLTLRMRTKEIGYMKYYGQFGVNPEYVIEAKSRVDYHDGSDPKMEGVMSEVTNFDLSLVIGLGVEYNLSGTTNFLIGLSYHNGLIDMLNGKAGEVDLVERNVRLNQIALNLGILF